MTSLPLRTTAIEPPGILCFVSRFSMKSSNGCIAGVPVWAAATAAKEVNATARTNVFIDFPQNEGGGSGENLINFFLLASCSQPDSVITSPGEIAPDGI